MNITLIQAAQDSYEVLSNMSYITNHTKKQDTMSESQQTASRVGQELPMLQIMELLDGEISTLKQIR
jgi:hypothetical protein